MVWKEFIAVSTSTRKFWMVYYAIQIIFLWFGRNSLQYQHPQGNSGWYTTLFKLYFFGLEGIHCSINIHKEILDGILRYSNYISLVWKEFIAVSTSTRKFWMVYYAIQIIFLWFGRNSLQYQHPQGNSGWYTTLFKLYFFGLEGIHCSINIHKEILDGILRYSNYISLIWKEFIAVSTSTRKFWMVYYAIQIIFLWFGRNSLQYQHPQGNSGWYTTLFKLYFFGLEGIHCSIIIHKEILDGILRYSNYISLVWKEFIAVSSSTRKFWMVYYAIQIIFLWFGRNSLQYQHPQGNSGWYTTLFKLYFFGLEGIHCSIIIHKEILDGILRYSNYISLVWKEFIAVSTSTRKFWMVYYAIQIIFLWFGRNSLQYQHPQGNSEWYTTLFKLYFFGLEGIHCSIIIHKEILDGILRYSNYISLVWKEFIAVSTSTRKFWMVYYAIQIIFLWFGRNSLQYQHPQGNSGWYTMLFKLYFFGLVCIPHNLLIAKLYVYGFDKNSLRLIHSYLKGRHQRVKINS